MGLDNWPVSLATTLKMNLSNRAIPLAKSMEMTFSKMILVKLTS